MIFEGRGDVASNFVIALRRPISVDRLESYRPVGGTDTATLVNYLWNIELSEALYPSLQALEVSFRNGIHAAASSRYGTEFWFDEPGALLQKQLDMIAEARAKVQKSGRPMTAGRIVAAAPFGFWTSLLNRPYEMPHSTAPPNRLFWHDAKSQPLLLSAAFPSVPQALMTRGAVWQRMNGIRELRNRVFHHEPIWNRNTLAREHKAILDAIGWISLEMQAMISLCDRFESVYEYGKPQIENKVGQRFAEP